MDAKKNLFVIVAVAVVFVGLIGWYLMTPDATEAKTAAIENSTWAAKVASGQTEITNNNHVALVKDYSKKLDDERQHLINYWKDRAKIDTGFPKPAPINDKNDFLAWLTERRNEFKDRMAKFALTPPANFDALTFKDAGEGEKKEVREARLRQMAIIDEIIRVLSIKPYRQAVTKFAIKPEDETKENVLVGPTAIEQIQIYSVDETAKRWDDAYKAALARSSSDRKTSLTARDTSEKLPYTITSVDIKFVSPMGAVPQIIKELEGSRRYLGTISRFDVQRAGPSFPPPPSDTKLAKPEAIPGVNSYYQEGPVRVLVTLDLYEYDHKEAAAAATTTTAKKN